MALTNKAVGEKLLGEPFITKANHEAKRNLGRFIHAITLGDNYQALYYLLQSFAYAEDERLIHLEHNDLTDALFDFGDLISEQLSNMNPNKIDTTNLNVTDGWRDKELYDEFCEVETQAHSGSSADSANLFKNILKLRDQFQEFGISLSYTVEAINQLNEAIQAYSFEIIEIANEFLQYDLQSFDLYRMDKEFVWSMFLYHELLEALRLCLNGVVLYLQDIYDYEELGENVEFRLGRLLALPLDGLFEVPIDVDAFVERGLIYGI